MGKRERHNKVERGVHRSCSVVQRKFTSKERDNETGLDYFLARYYSSTQGRFTSPDEFSGGPEELYFFAQDAAENPTFYAELENPQSLNKYQYTYNNPLRYTDATGHCVGVLRLICTPAGQRAIERGGQRVIERATPYVAVVVGALGAATEWARTGNTAGDASCPGCTSSERMGQALIEKSNDAPTEVTIDGSKHPEAARHAADAQKAGQPDTLTVDRGGARDRRRDATSGTKPTKGKDRDEYPPAVTKEGGKGASVRPISPRDNRGAGASIGNQIKKVPDGGKIKIKIELF